MRPQLTVLLLTHNWLALVEIGGSAASCVPATPYSTWAERTDFLTSAEVSAAKCVGHPGLGHIQRTQL